MRPIDLDKALLASILASGSAAYLRAVEQGISKDALDGEAKLAWEFIELYWKEYKALPTAPLVYGKTDVMLGEEAEGNPDFFIAEVLNRNLYLRLRAEMQSYVKLLEERKPREALEAMDRTVHDLRQTVANARVVDFVSHNEEVLRLYDQAQSGVRGIPFPWPTLTEATMGMSPEDLVIMAARTGVGKTFAGLLFARAAWEAGRRVLVVTTEMAQVRLVQRFYAIHLRLPYGAFLRGRLPEDVWVRAQQQIRDFDTDRLKLIGGAFDFKMPTLEAAIDEAKPDLVFVDGAYLLVTEGRDRFDRAASAFNELKRIAKRCHIPIIASSQFNRQADTKKEATITDANLALTDVGAWNADMILALYRTEDMKREKRMRVRALKLREASLDKDIDVYWDFDEMRFDEIPEEGGGDASEPVSLDLGPQGSMDDDQSVVPF